MLATALFEGIEGEVRRANDGQDAGSIAVRIDCGSLASAIFARNRDTRPG
jgi:hypothetical protein